jgi:hypothetical protein
MTTLSEALRELVRQISINDFTDSHGHTAKMLKAYHDGVSALAAHDAQQQEQQPDLGGLWSATAGAARLGKQVGYEEGIRDAAQQQEPLTDAQIDAIFAKHFSGFVTVQDQRNAARAIESAIRGEPTP